MKRDLADCPSICTPASTPSVPYPSPYQLCNPRGPSARTLPLHFDYPYICRASEAEVSPLSAFLYVRAGSHMDRKPCYTPGSFVTQIASNPSTASAFDEATNKSSPHQIVSFLQLPVRSEGFFLTSGDLWRRSPSGLLPLSCMILPYSPLETHFLQEERDSGVRWRFFLVTIPLWVQILGGGF